VIKLKKTHILVLLIILLVVISGCKIKGGKKKAEKSLEEIRTGTEGIMVGFLPNTPPDKIPVDKANNIFDVVLEVKNKGAYPQPADTDALRAGFGYLFGYVYLSGFDDNIITFQSRKAGVLEAGNVGRIDARTFEGKSTINPNGGLDLLEFKGTVTVQNLNVEKYEPTLQATACYVYETIAGPPVCIDPNPYSTVKEKKVCEVQPVTLTNQGAPVAVTRIDEEALSGRTQFKITIKNVGGGDVLRDGDGAIIKKCNPAEQLRIERGDIDKVKVVNVKIANQELICGPFAEVSPGISKGQDITRAVQGWIRLINGEGFVICEMPRDPTKKTAYTTPLTIRLHYGYRTTIEKKIQIKNEAFSSIRRAEEGGTSVAESPSEQGDVFDSSIG